MLDGRLAPGRQSDKVAANARTSNTRTMAGTLAAGKIGVMRSIDPNRKDRRNTVSSQAMSKVGKSAADMDFYSIDGMPDQRCTEN
ncbi:hypothetical protein CS8_012610 [Cupriavidus sp. 8B]